MLEKSTAEPERQKRHSCPSFGSEITPIDHTAVVEPLVLIYIIKKNTAQPALVVAGGGW
jgi:hypothetical protein